MGQFLSISTLLLFLLFNGFIAAQNISPYQPIIGQIGELENTKDAKCHATASRLEDFVFGTPLSFEARSRRIEFQQDFAEKIWLDYSQILKNRATKNELEIFHKVEATYLTYHENEKGIVVHFPNGKKIAIDARDFRQYSTVAYALRAILAVQQSYSSEPEKLTHLNEEVIREFKKTIDIAVLSVLDEADQFARNDNSSQIKEAHIEKAIGELFPESNHAVLAPHDSGSPTKNIALLYDIIGQKLASYHAYNDINQNVFLRNIQVYFSKIPWPAESGASVELKNYFNEAMIQFTVSLLEYAQELALKQNKKTIQYKDVFQTVQAFLPHSVNAFEDVAYFPNLGKQGQMTIEAYDLDAFRDSGLHWQYLKFALDDKGAQLKIAPDPFALEMLVEGVAQFAVLIFRMGGMDAKTNGQETLEIPNINNALVSFQNKLEKYPSSPPVTKSSKIISGAKSKNETVGELFSEASNEVGLNFEHRNSDWLSRLIRSYVVKESENLARLAIPPAFGGGGVAAEDFDSDGWVDVLLLGGKGNQLLKNENGKRLVNITEKAGLDWKREDGNYGEPRQPIIADFDNDGWQDIFISYANDLHRIYRNRGDGTFEDMTETANLGGIGLVGGPCTALDYNKDGLLDLYIGYFGNYLKGELPTLKRHNTNGTPNVLFKNMGGFKFQDVSQNSGLENGGWTQAVGHSDINGDGWQDVIVGNDFGVNGYYINNKNGTFTDISAEIGTDKPSYTMNIGISDLNRDLRPDFYISNIVVMEKDDKYVLPNEDTPAHFNPASLSTMRVVEANDLFVSTTDERGQLDYNKSTEVGRGYAATGWSWDADFFDFDNDTDDDLYCLTGMNEFSVYGPDNPYYDSPEGESKSVTFANSNQEPNIFFENKNGFLEVAENTGCLHYPGTSRSAAYFDMDNDGDLDIIVNEYQGSAKLFLNRSENLHNHWVKIKLVGDPANKITKDGIGATLVLSMPDGDKQWKEVYSTTGYLSGHPKTLHFGLGENESFDLEIRWPDGHVQNLKNSLSDQTYTIHYERD